jgi:hypothetical protein
MSTSNKIKQKCKELEELLLMKNSKYGNSALEPLNVFSEAGAVAGIKMRIDDKLKRIKNAGLVDATEDTLQDLAGYLILLMIAKDNEGHDFQRRIRQGETLSRSSGDGSSTYPEWELEYQD